MKRFRAPKKRTEYKNIDSYLDAVWRKNKDYIEKNMENYSDFDSSTIIYKPKSKKARWKKMVKEIFKAREYDQTLDRNIKNIDEAIDKATRSTAFTYDFRKKSVIEKELKNTSPLAYKEIRRIIGKTTKFSFENLEFVGYGDGGEEWYEYEFQKSEKVEVEIARGKNKGKKVLRYTGQKIQEKFYLVYIISDKSGQGGYYEVRWDLPRQGLVV